MIHNHLKPMKGAPLAKLSDMIESDPIRALVYGVSGSGKTTLAGLMAMHEELRPIYYFDWDLRLASLRARLPKEVWPFIEVDQYRDKNLPGEAFTLMQAKLDRLEGSFKTAVIDSMTFAMQGIMARVLFLDGNKAPTTTPQLQHYMQQQSLVVDLISRLCSKKINIIVTGHEDTSKDEITGRMFKALDLTGKLATRIPGYFNEFWHTELVQQSGQEPQFKVRTRSDQVFAARTSFRTLQTMEDQATIWTKILKEKQGNAK